MGNTYMKWRNEENEIPGDDRDTKAEDGAGIPPPQTAPPPKDVVQNIGKPASNVFDTSLGSRELQPVHF
tara:strand:- start:286 stop:492 length:207 start_codon:yes stop_codon:yes gene_type:complete